MRDYFEFENLIKEIFRFKNFEVSDENEIFKSDAGETHGIDFLASKNNKKYVVEVKFYRQTSQNTSLISRAAKQLLIDWTLRIKHFENSV